MFSPAHRGHWQSTSVDTVLKFTFLGCDLTVRLQIRCEAIEKDIGTTCTCRREQINGKSYGPPTRGTSRITSTRQNVPSVRRAIFLSGLGSRRNAATCHALSNCERRATATYAPVLCHLRAGLHQPRIWPCMCDGACPQAPPHPPVRPGRGVNCAGCDRGATKRRAAESRAASCGALAHGESPAAPSTKQTPVSPSLEFLMKFV